MECKVSEGSGGGVGAVCLFFLAVFNTWYVHACMLGCFRHVRLFVTLWAIAHQAPLSMGFSRQEYWTGLSCPPQGDLSNSGIEPRSPLLQVDSLPTEPPGKPHLTHYNHSKKTPKPMVLADWDVHSSPAPGLKCIAGPFEEMSFHDQTTRPLP